MLMRGTPPTIRSPPHQSRPTENPPNLQPATVGEEERGGRDPTSRRTSMRAASDCRPPPTALHRRSPAPHQPPPPAKGRSPQLRPCTGKVASAGAGPLRRDTRPVAGHARAPPPPPPAPPPQPHTTRPPPTTTRPEERRTSCRQQPAPPPRNAANMSPRISIGPEPVLAAHAPPTFSGQPLPGERRLSSALGNR
jgi:hypothetical protein